MVVKKGSMPTLQLNTKDYGKYALFDADQKDGDIHPVFLSFSLSEAMKKAKELKKSGELENPAVEQVKDPRICWNY